jgi:hypothetical protein
MMNFVPWQFHFISLGAVGFWFLYWGMKQQAEFKEEHLNSTTWLGIILVLISITSVFYSQGVIFGSVYLIVAIIIGKSYFNVI